jgi:glycosyltransferase involved in cell wall biosynthesis
MRINCIIGPYLPVPAKLGGAVEKIFLALCEEFARSGHAVTMISRAYAGLPAFGQENGITHIRVPSRDRPTGTLEYRFFDLIYALRVSRILPDADVTITNSVAMPLVIPKRRAGKIYVDVARYPKGQMGMYRRVDRLQACSTHIARAVCEQSPSVAHLVKAVPNALTQTFAMRALETDANQRNKEIVFVGRIAREKGVDLLIKAFGMITAQHPDWRLSVIGPHLAAQGGDGEGFLAELRAMTADLGARVDFVGPIFDEAQLADRYAQAAVFVYPSVAERGEAFPLAPLEAMACGSAVVVSDLRCFDDAVAPGRNGLAFDHRDPTGGSLARVLDRLMTSAALREEISSRGKETSRRYAPAEVAKLFMSDFAELTGLEPCETPPVRRHAFQA